MISQVPAAAIPDAAISKYASIFGLMFVFPCETVMPAVGFAAANGNISIAAALLAGVSGSVLGSLLIYFIFRQVRIVTTDRFLAKHGAKVGLSAKRVKRAENWFDKHGDKAVFAARFVPAVRTAVCIPAGLAHMPLGTYLTYTLLGTLIDCSLLIYLGYTAGDNYEAIKNLMADFVAWSWVLLVILVLLLLVHYRANRTK